MGSDWPEIDRDQSGFEPGGVVEKTVKEALGDQPEANEVW
jgi:hypothetical protein